MSLRVCPPQNSDHTESAGHRSAPLKIYVSLLLPEKFPDPLKTFPVRLSREFAQKPQADRGFFDTWAGKQATRELFSVLALYWIVSAANGRTATQSLQGTGRPDAQSLTDGEVVTGVLAGEVGPFEILMRRYNRRLYRIARAILRDEAEAKDTVQQAYLNAYANLDDSLVVPRSRRG